MRLAELMLPYIVLPGAGNLVPIGQVTLGDISGLMSKIHF